MNTNTPTRRLVITGGGTAGWMVAALMGRLLGKQLDIRLVESEEIGTVGVGEATIPTLLTFHNLLDINEAEFMAATQATIKLGIRFEHWRNVDEHYIHSFGMTGTDHWSAGFQHFWLKGRQEGIASDYGDYCLELRAAEAMRFAHLPRGGMNYAFHFDAGLYARYLRRYSERHGVQRVEGRIVGVEREGDCVKALQLQSGERIEGDLFVDCSGFRSLLLGETLGVPFEDWSAWLPCDRALAVQTESVGEARPYTRSIAHPFGWQWQIPLQHRVGNGLVFSSRYVELEQAREALLAKLDGKPLFEPRLLKFTPGQRAQCWKGNVVAIGLASGFIEPLESTSIHLIQRGAIRLAQLFPAAGIQASDVAEYNAQMREELEHIRDFIVLHYHLQNRDDAPMWRDMRAMAIPDSLRHRIELFRESGRVFRIPNELFAENSWVQVMLGQGLTPQRYHPVADLMGPEELSAFLGGIRSRVDSSLQQLPSHQQYIERYCKAALAA